MSEKVVNIPYNQKYTVEFNNSGNSIVKPISQSDKDINIFSSVFSIVAMVLALAAIIYAIVFLVNRQNPNTNGRAIGPQVRIDRRQNRRANVLP